MRTLLPLGPGLGLTLLATLVPGTRTSVDPTQPQPMLEAQSGAETTDPATLLVVPSSQDKTTQAQLSLQIYKQPDDVTVCVGDAATFSVTAFPEAATYQWRKDGTPISGETSASLTINPTSVADAGSYDVVVSYRSRSRTSTTAELSVNAGPVITTQPANQSAMVGDSVTFTVVADGVGPITYQWRKRQGVFGSTMTPIPGATASTYTIDPVSSGDSGTYDCLLTDGCGSKRTRRAILTVSF